MYFLSLSGILIALATSGLSSCIEIKCLFILATNFLQRKQASRLLYSRFPLSFDWYLGTFISGNLVSAECSVLADEDSALADGDSASADRDSASADGDSVSADADSVPADGDSVPADVC